MFVAVVAPEAGGLCIVNLLSASRTQSWMAFQLRGKRKEAPLQTKNALKRCQKLKVNTVRTCFVGFDLL